MVEQVSSLLNHSAVFRGIYIIFLSQAHSPAECVGIVNKYDGR